MGLIFRGLCCGIVATATAVAYSLWLSPPGYVTGMSSLCLYLALMHSTGDAHD